MNYTTLQANVASWLHRTDLTTPITSFIDQARLRLGTELRANCNFTTGTVTSFVDGLSALPANLARLAGVADSNGFPLQEVSVGEAGIGYTQGVYAVAGSDLWVPDAGSSDVVTLTYWTIPAALSSGSDVSEGMDELPQLWIWASVHAGAIYCHDFDLADRVNGYYLQLLETANRQCSESRWMGASVQNFGANVYAGNSGL